jgi:small-conductance mechanosensitive channel
MSQVLSRICTNLLPILTLFLCCTHLWIPVFAGHAHSAAIVHYEHVGFDQAIQSPAGLAQADSLTSGTAGRQYLSIDDIDQQKVAIKKAQIDSLRQFVSGIPVAGLLNDTLFYVYSKLGAYSPQERSKRISERIRILYDDDFLKIDSIILVQSDFTYDIIYDDLIIMTVTETDAMWNEKPLQVLAMEYTEIIKKSIAHAKDVFSLYNILIRVALAILVLLAGWLIVWLIGLGTKRLIKYIDHNKAKLLKNLTYHEYTFLSAEQEFRAIMFLIKLFRWSLYALVLYIALPILFSIFPFTRHWATILIELVWSPFRGILHSLWNYLPNLFSIIVIYLVMRYIIRFVRYIFHEIELGKLRIAGFYSDWSMPTYSIVKFLLYAFMFVLIFPYLPGSDSDIFKGVSVFIGILFSLGSSSAIANAVAGLVITYMRPFKIGDRIKIADVSGDVIEKSLLVTRIRTIKNEIITIPNGSVLTGNTINYTVEAAEKGLIIHTGVTIGYDVPWRDMHKALLDAAARTEMILKDPEPFVLQTSLDDFYVAYQINGYTRHANRQAMVYSALHQNIQDVCNERGIEIMSPHYRAARDGSNTTIPANYLPKDYKAPGFNVNIENPGK